MNSQGIKGAIYDDEKKQIIDEIEEIDTGYSGLNGYNGLSGNKYGSGGVYQYGIFNNNNKDSNSQKCFIGFGGGCAKHIKESKGGDGGGKIILLCNELIVEKESKITSNGENGIKSGGGGSGGSILIVSNHINIHHKSQLSVNGGKGDTQGRNGTDGIIQFGYIIESELKYVSNIPLHNAYKFHYINKTPLIECSDILTQTKYLKSKLFSLIKNNEIEEEKYNENIFIKLGNFFNDLGKKK
eukprot:512663_1